ncbi:MAG TPA: hypothetical protein VFJ70_23315 [Burkholderiales bacterium]|nr:hypothetical protein [Burkholderiales bacterium]
MRSSQKSAAEFGDHGESRITQCAAYVRVDFGGCNEDDLRETYRAFVGLCLDTRANRALLKAGDDYAPGHYALCAMARQAALAPDFKLALVPSTVPVEAVYREAQQHLRAQGCNAWVFRSESEALEWLEGRAPRGETAS